MFIKELIKNKRFLLLISAISIIFVLIILADITFEPNEPITPWRNAERLQRERNVIPSFMIWVFLTLIISSITPLFYFYMSKKIDEKLEKNIQIISKFTNLDENLKENGKKINDPQIILKFLNQTERKIIKEMIKNNGEILQSQISRMDNMSKLKAHRAIKDLEKKEIIKKEEYGKTKKIILQQEIKNFFLN